MLRRLKKLGRLKCLKAGCGCWGQMAVRGGNVESVFTEKLTPGFVTTISGVLPTVVEAVTETEGVGIARVTLGRSAILARLP